MRISIFVYLFISSFIVSQSIDIKQQTLEIKKEIEHSLQAKPSTIKIINRITQKDLGYYKAFSNHYPKKFYLEVNGKRISSGQTIDTDNRRITIVYGYQWSMPWGTTREGAKKIVFETPDGITNMDITFAGWQKNNRIEISNAHKVTDEIELPKSAISFSPNDVY